MPDINFRLTATDEATPVIDRLRRKMDSMNRPGASSGGSARSSGGSSGNAGTGGFLGSGKIGGVAGLTIIAQAALQALQKIYATLLQASPYLRAVSDQFKVAMSIYLRPLGDSLARILAPQSEYAIEMADARAKVLEDLDKQFGFVGVLLGTFGFGLYDAWNALFDFQYGVLNALSSVLMWPIDQLGKMFGVDLPGSLNEILEDLFGIKGGFRGLRQWFETDMQGAFSEWSKEADAWARGVAQGIIDSLSGFGSYMWDGLTGILSSTVGILSGFGSWLWEKITAFVGDPLGTLANLGSWLWDKITGFISSPMATLAGFSSWLYNKLKDTLGGLPAEAYKAFHNAIASLLNSIANIELPLVGKPFKGLLGTIPMLASGGIVTKPTLAMIGERGAEAVIPLNRGGLGMNQGITVQINAPVYGVGDLESAIDNAIRRSQMGYASYR